ncbi:right-handed parallel beta-helix repeat-containing protein [Haladaptatus sp. NG-SE-30]
MRDGLAVLFVVIVTLVGASSAPDPVIGVASGTDSGISASQTAVDSCREISDPGRYVLTDDLTNTTESRCLRITANDVVLDGEGHRVDGVGAFGSAGVLVTSGSNVTVQNVTASDWDDGIRLTGIRNATVRNTTTMRNRVGLSLVSFRDGTVADNIARSNAVAGVFLVGASRNNALRNTTATDNALVGIQLVEATENTVVGTDARRNEFGIALFGANGNTVRDSVAVENRIAGIWLSGASDNRIRENRVSNRFYGVYLADGARNNTIVENVARENPVGVRLRSSDGNAILRNRILDSSDTGILLISSDENRVAGNRGRENRRDIVVSRTSAGNTLENNSVGERSN